MEMEMEYENLVTVRFRDAEKFLKSLTNEDVAVNSSEQGHDGSGPFIDYSFDGQLSEEAKEAIASFALYTYYADEQ